MQNTAKCDVTQEFCSQQRQQEAKQDPEASALPRVEEHGGGERNHCSPLASQAAQMQS